MSESTAPYVPPSPPTPPRGERSFTGNDEPKPARRRADKPAPEFEPESDSEPDSDPNDPGPVPPSE